jgi:phosphatidate cytidylyltransferase
MPSKRVLTALVGLPLFLLLVFKAPLSVFSLAVLVVALLGLKEFYDLMEGGDTRLQKFLGLLMGALLIRSFYYADFTLIVRVLALAVLLTLIVRTFSGRAVTHAAQEVGITFLGLMYVCFFLGYLVLIRDQAHGQAWIFFLFLLIWAGDTGAYYVGRAFGKRKLLERISPNKTVEGAVGGLASTVAAAWLCRPFLFPEVTVFSITLLALVLGLAGQVGDLAESLLKRSSGAKDSGTLFPGHGGVLDRFDGILFASPILYYAVWLGYLQPA